MKYCFFLIASICTCIHTLYMYTALCMYVCMYVCMYKRNVFFLVACTCKHKVLTFLWRPIHVYNKVGSVVYLLVFHEYKKTLYKMYMNSPKHMFVICLLFRVRYVYL